MKPTVQIVRPARRGVSQRPAAHSIITAPVTDWSFQAGAANFSGHRGLMDATPNPAAAFRSLSQAFFDAESKRGYRTEAGAFIVIGVLAIWPIAQAIHAALTLLK